MKKSSGKKRVSSLTFLIATTAVPEYGATIRAIILCGTLIYEMVGPALAKLSLTKAGEIPK